MQSTRHRRALGWAIALAALGATRGAAQVDFATQVRPIFQSKCIKCHGPDESKGGLRLDSRAAMLKDDVVVPGSSADSVLVMVLEDGEMPPKGEGAPPSQAQIQLIRDWIDQGAPWGAAKPKPEPQPDKPDKPAAPADESAEPKEGADAAAEPDAAPVAGPLPATVDREIDFARDIHPLLRRKCFSCHGPERQRGDFRLDSREAALQGGGRGVAIVPGHSAGSPLIHFVARQVEGMEMPPEDSGAPLTEAEVGLLRAWIDQGAPWSEAAEAPDFAFSIAPMLRWYSVDGNERKFREQAWRRDGSSGGVSRFTLESWLDLDTRLTAEGAFDAPGNYDFTLALDRPGAGFIRGGVEQFRRYDNDYGGSYEPFEAFVAPAFRLDRDLHLDIGRVWAEFGVTPPGGLEFVLGYEYRYKRGERSTLHWGPSVQGGMVRNIYPSFMDVDEDVHILRADLRYASGGLELENNFMVEALDLDTRRSEVSPMSFGATPDAYTSIAESQDSFQVTNTFSLQKRIKDWWLLTGGYYYSSLDADAAFRQDTFSALGEPVVGQHWFSRPIVIDWDAHIFNLSTRLGPWEGLTFTAGFQGEWQQQDAMGTSTLFFGLPDPAVEIPPFFVSQVGSSRQSATATEHAALRFDRLPYTVLFAEAEWEQDRTDYFEQDLGGLLGFRRDTESRSTDRDYRAGATVSPWPAVSLNTHYRYRLKQNDYDHLLDEGFGGGPGPGYSAFILGRDIETHEFQSRLNLRPKPWMRTQLSYRRQATDYETDTEAIDFGGPADTPGGWLLAGEYTADVYSLNVVLTPWERVALNGSFSYHDSRTRTASNDDPAVDDFEGDIYSVLVGGTYQVNDKTTVNAHYSFSQGDFTQDNVADGIPLGIEYRQHSLQAGLSTQLGENVRLGLHYLFQSYREPSSGDVNDFTAHGVFASCTLNWK